MRVKVGELGVTSIMALLSLVKKIYACPLMFIGTSTMAIPLLMPWVCLVDEDIWKERVRGREGTMLCKLDVGVRKCANHL